MPTLGEEDANLRLTFRRSRRLSPDGSWKPLQSSIWEIVFKDCLKVGTMLRHVARPALAKAETVSLADALENDLVLFFVAREIVARNGIPTEAPADGEASVFAA